MPPAKKSQGADSKKTTTSTTKAFSGPGKITPKEPTQISSDFSDAKYILVLFILALIVVIFGILVYIFSQSPSGQPQQSETQMTFEEALAEAETRTQLSDEQIQADFERLERSGDESSPTQPTTETVDASTFTPSTTVSRGRTFTIPADFDESKYNPRSDASRSLYGSALIEAYFASISAGNYKDACSLTTNTICNARRDIFAFENFLSQLKDGYTLENVYEANEQKDDQKIYCVLYSYKLKADLNQTPITELFQYRVSMRPDGADEISARVCEKVIKDGRDRPCPIQTPKKYCDV